MMHGQWCAMDCVGVWIPWLVPVVLPALLALSLSHHWSAAQLWSCGFVYLHMTEQQPLCPLTLPSATRPLLALQ